MQIDSTLRSIAAVTGTGTAAASVSTSPTPTPKAGSSGATTAAAVSTTEFMKLLSTEMANQDPMQPMDPTATMTQLAQFSSLQQSSQISQYQSLAAANSFLGSQVTIPGANGAPAVTGTVTGIDASGVSSGSTPLLIVNGATQEYPLTAVSRVTVPASASASAAPAPAQTQ